MMGLNMRLPCSPRWGGLEMTRGEGWIPAYAGMTGDEIATPRHGGARNDIGMDFHLRGNDKGMWWLWVGWVGIQ